MKLLPIAAISAAVIAGSGLAVAVAESTHTATGSTSTVTVTAASGSNAAATSSIGQVYDATVDGVVEITAQRTSGDGFTPFGEQQGTAQGTGFVIDTEGHIVTNAHVVNGASSVNVALHDGETRTAQVVGIDEATDLAVLKVDAPAGSLHPLRLGDSEAVSVGDPVIAIGNPFGLEDTVTAGIVSALDRTITSPNNRPITGVIQTDAPINHGNSGGPLLNQQGEVIGVASQIQADSGNGGNVGIGFAVPSNTVKTVAEGLIANGKVEHASIGIFLAPAQNGVEITRVNPGSAGDDAGLQAGDVITEVDGNPITSSEELISVVAAKQPGDPLQLTITRNGSSQTIDVTLGSA
jgi:putative serine protease PepD